MHLKDCTLVSKETGYYSERLSSLSLVNVRVHLRTVAHGAVLKRDLARLSLLCGGSVTCWGSQADRWVSSSDSQKQNE